MESNTVLNVVQELGNDRRRHRHTFGLGEAQLFKMLSSTPVEPLFINDSANSKAALNGCINNSADNLLTQYDTATSSIATVDDYENENLPPTDNNCAVTNNEGYIQFFFCIFMHLFSTYFMVYHLVFNVRHFVTSLHTVQSAVIIYTNV